MIEFHCDPRDSLWGFCLIWNKITFLFSYSHCPSAEPRFITESERKGRRETQTEVQLSNAKQLGVFRFCFSSRYLDFELCVTQQSSRITRGRFNLELLLLLDGSRTSNPISGFHLSVASGRFQISFDPLLLYDLWAFCAKQTIRFSSLFLV